MRAAHLMSLVTMLLATAHAGGACTPLRLGYVNQHRPPYFIGSSSAEAAAPGATVELIRDVASSAGCGVTSVRLPPLRLRKAMDSNAIDAMLMDAAENDVLQYALPLTTGGKLDEARAVRMYTVVFVRANDKLAADTDPRHYFSTHKLGMNNGATLATQLRRAGYTVDDGATDAVRNLEKLARGRIDGYAATMVAPDSADSRIAATHGKQIVRLDTPLRTHNFWLAFTKAYYDSNRKQVDTMWSWMGTHGHEQFSARVKQYEKAP